MSALERARQAVGTRFRRQGRGPDSYDCVGLVGWAHDLAVPGDYPAWSSDPARVAAALRSAGFHAATQAEAGDVLVLQSGPGQLHLAIATGQGIVHADAVARAVVERRGVPWPVIAIWRR